MYNSAVDGVATRVTYTTTPSVTTRASGEPTIGRKPGRAVSCPNAQRSTTVLAAETQLPVTIPISAGAKRNRTSVRLARDSFANSISPILGGEEDEQPPSHRRCGSMYRNFKF